MKDIRQQVALCFANVFPDLDPASFSTASASRVAAWDSVAQVTLLSALSEEFDVDFEPEDYEELLSFPQIVAFLENRIGS